MQRSTKVVASGAAALLVIDGLVLGQGGISLLASLIALPILLFRTVSAIAKRGDDAPARVIALVIWASVVALTFVFIRLSDRYGLRHREEVVRACERYRQDHGVYPASLAALTPDYLAAIPHARLALAFREFDYHNLDGSPSLHYVVIPPFGRNVYVFDRHEWMSID